MSVRMSTWVWQHSGAAGNDLLLLLALADIADDSGRCWPSTAHLAKKTRLSRATVQRRLHTMTEEGRIVTKDRKGTSNVYEFRLESGEYDGPEVAALYLPQTEAPTPLQPATGSRTRPVAPDATGGASPTATGGVAVGATRTINEPSVTRQKPRKARAFSIPDDFKITPAMVSWQREQGITDADARRETTKFRNHAAAKATRYVDWTAAWRNWLLHAIDYGNITPRPGVGAGPVDPEAVLGRDLWQLPAPPVDVEPGTAAFTEWAQAQRAEHQAQRQAQAREQLERRRGA